MFGYYLLMMVAVFVGVSIPQAIAYCQNKKRDEQEAKLLNGIWTSMLLSKEKR